MEYLQLALLGLGTAAAYSLLASGMVLIYRASGVLNFAQGAMAAVGAYIFYELHVDEGWPWIPAAIVCILVLAGLGAIIYLGIMRSLRNAAVLVRIIATLCVLVIIQAITTLHYQATILEVTQYLPNTTLHWGVGFPESILWLIGIALALTLILGLWATRTRFGLATRGVAENQRTAAASGWSPDYVATVNWAIGSGLAGLAGIMIVPTSSLSTTSLTWLVVPALAVALLGAFSSFWLAFVGAVVVGMAQGALTNFEATVPGVSDAVPLAVILIALVVQRQAIPIRGEVLHRLPSLGRGLFKPVVVIPCLILGILGSLFLSENWVVALGVSVVAGIIVLSVIVVTGYAGQLSLGQYALAGLGALIAAQVVTNLHWAFPAALVLGTLGAGACGFIFGLPSLRSRGAALAIVTLGMGTAIGSLIFANASIAGGAYGFSVNSQTFFGINLDPIQHPRTYTIFCLCWFAVCIWCISNLRRSRAGRRLISIRANERAAVSLGVGVGMAKLFAFTVSAALAGLGGVLLAFSSDAIVLSQGYDQTASVNAVMLGVVGGVGHLTGSVFAGTLASGGIPGGLIANAVSGSNGPEWLILIGGALTLITLMLNPDGIAGPFDLTVRKIGALLGRLGRGPAAGAGTAAASATFTSALDRPGGPELAAVTGERREDNRLAVAGLAVSFGGVRALRGVDLEVRSGQIMGLIGPNGSGKTTFIDGLTGYVKSSGQVLAGNVRIDLLPPHKRVQAGITRSFQSLELFDDVTVEENLRAAADDGSRAAYLTALFPARKQQIPASVQSVIDEFQLGSVLQVMPRHLSYGQRRLVAIARAVATSPDFLLLDEPAAGLGSTETAELSHIVTRLAREWNIGILLVEHDMSMVLGICDRIAVLEFGEKIAEGTPAEIRNDPRVVSAYLGVQASETQAETQAEAEAEQLSTLSLEGN